MREDTKMIHVGLVNPSPSDASEDKRARKTTVTPANAFADRNARPFLDFDKSGPAAQSSGMNGSAFDLYAPSWKAEMAKKADNDARADKLLPAVRQLAQSHGLDLEALEVINLIHRGATVMRGNPVQVFRSDIARATGLPVSKVDDIVREAVTKGLLSERNNSYWVSRL
ncbi:hypothetical protein [Bosea sp. (in: a-proteobacteria)]|uniref:hypothetical protein n=1 Tax=Bosea sp. (in: a-proteobacteria) TaxID=1871050 RepID=UPI002604BF44|nr:hypothetical protein [Bosea sp. (in: a-proteobacteria)]MCO5090881.1 hypothetical protein [Bosea sp. (in: a-proteobacteria)]